MRRDMEFVKQMLSAMQNSDEVYFTSHDIAASLDIDDSNKVIGHLLLCMDAGFVCSLEPKTGEKSYRLTWQGSEFIEDALKSRKGRVSTFRI